MIPFEMALGTALRHWKLILGGLLVTGLLVALLLTRATLADAKHDLTKERAAHKETIANYKLAQEAAAVKAERQLREVEALYRRNADEAENLHAEQLADANAAAERFIRDNSVRTQSAQCSPSGTAATAASERAGVPAPMPSGAVMVSADDVRACTGAVTYALSAREWAMTLNERP